ncbi:hypothetical protein ABMA28_016387 [Loxostege sticticalis]|uniref:Chitin-binding type-2 domain-containing protein n=1 Tax=Loxostege sticticalis TaxID=481309 RepID=A0ABD0TAM2_LOXSC
MICVDLGGGVSSTIDNFMIPCPPSTECQKTNHFECEFPRSTTITPISETSVPSELGPSEISSVLDTSFISTTTEGVTSEVEPTDRTWNTVSITTLQEDSVTTNNTVTEWAIIENTTTNDYANVGYTFTTVQEEITSNTNIIDTSTPSDIGSFVTETFTPLYTVAMSTFNDLTVTTEKIENITTTDTSLLEYSNGTTTYEPVPNQSAMDTSIVNDTTDSFTTELYISTISEFASTINESSMVEKNLSMANNTFDNNLTQNTIQESIDTTVGTSTTVANIDSTYAPITETFTEAIEIITETVDNVATIGLTITSNGENISDQNITTTEEITYDITKSTDDVSHATESVPFTIPNNINNNTDIVFTTSTVETTTSSVLTAETVNILDQETSRFTFDGLPISEITTESNIPKDNTTFVSVTEPVSTQYTISEINDENQSSIIGVTSNEITPLITTQTPINTYTVPNEEIFTSNDPMTVNTVNASDVTMSEIKETTKDFTESDFQKITTEETSSKFSINPEINDNSIPSTVGTDDKYTFTGFTEDVNDGMTSTISPLSGSGITDSIKETIIGETTTETLDIKTARTVSGVTQYLSNNNSEITNLSDSTKEGFNPVFVTESYKITDNSFTTTNSIDNSLISNDTLIISSVSGGEITNSVNEKIVVEVSTDSFDITQNTVTDSTQNVSNQNTLIHNVPESTKESTITMFTTETYKMTDSSFDIKSDTTSFMVNDKPSISPVSGSELVDSIKETVVGETTTESVDIKSSSTLTDLNQNTVITNVADSIQYSTNPIYVTESSNMTTDSFTTINFDNSFSINDTSTMSPFFGSKIIDSVKDTLFGETTTTETQHIEIGSTITGPIQNVSKQDAVILNASDNTKDNTITKSMLITESNNIADNSLTTTSLDKSLGINDTSTIKPFSKTEIFDFVLETIIGEVATESLDIKTGNTETDSTQNVSDQNTLLQKTTLPIVSDSSTNTQFATESYKMSDNSFTLKSSENSLNYQDQTSLTESSTTVFQHNSFTAPIAANFEATLYKIDTYTEQDNRNISESEKISSKISSTFGGDHHANLTEKLNANTMLKNVPEEIIIDFNENPIDSANKDYQKEFPASVSKVTTESNQNQYNLSNYPSGHINKDIQSLDYLKPQFVTVKKQYVTEGILSNQNQGENVEASSTNKTGVGFNGSKFVSTTNDGSSNQAMVLNQKFDSAAQTSETNTINNTNVFSVDSQATLMPNDGAIKQSLVLDQNLSQNAEAKETNTVNEMLTTKVTNDNSLKQPLTNNNEKLDETTELSIGTSLSKPIRENSLSENTYLPSDSPISEFADENLQNKLENVAVEPQTLQKTDEVTITTLTDQKKIQNAEAKETNTANKIFMTKATEITDVGSLKQPLTNGEELGKTTELNIGKSVSKPKGDNNLSENTNLSSDSPISKFSEENVHNNLENVAKKQQTLQKSDEATITTSTDQKESPNAEAKETNTVYKKTMTNVEELDKTTELNIRKFVSKADSNLSENPNLSSDSQISVFPENVQSKSENVAVEQQTLQNTDEVTITASTESSVKYSTQNANTDSVYRFINEQKVTESFCSTRNRGRYADREDCTKFYICIGKPEPIVGKCPSNTVFSEIKKQCTKNHSHCVRENEFKCLSEGRFSDILKNNAYYICIKRHNHFYRFKFQCQNGYYLNKLTVRCAKQLEKINQSSTSVDNSNSEKSVSEGMSQETKKSENNKDSKRENKSGEEFECKKEGKFADPNNCRKFYVCTKTKKSEFRMRRKSCDSDELFHKDKKKCVDADSYEC